MTIAINPTTTREISCPFCGDSDFDLIGLKIHLVRGHCEEFGKVDA